MHGNHTLTVGNLRIWIFYDMLLFWACNIHIYICVYIYMYMYIYIYIYMCIYIYTYMCIYIYTYIHTHTYTHIYIYIYEHCIEEHLSNLNCSKITHLYNSVFLKKYWVRGVLYMPLLTERWRLMISKNICKFQPCLLARCPQCWRSQSIQDRRQEKKEA